MKCAPHLISLAALAAGAGLLFAGEPARPAATGYIEKFEVPERDENGNLKWKLMGERAQIRDDGQLTVINMRAEFYSSNRVELVFTTPVCTVDQVKKRASTDAPVRLERPQLVVTGTGADWTAESNTFVIRSNVNVVLTGPAADQLKVISLP